MLQSKKLSLLYWVQYSLCSPMFDVKYKEGRFWVIMDDMDIISFPEKEEARAYALADRLGDVFDEFILVEFEDDDEDVAD